MARPKKLPDGLKLRGKKYYAWFTAHGQTVRKSLSGDLKIATEMLNDLRARIDRGDWGIVESDADIETIRKDYLEHVRQQLKPSSADRAEQCLGTILPRLGARRVSQVTQRAVVTYRAARTDAGLSPRTINMEVQSLQTMLRWAVKHLRIKSSPIDRIKPLRHDNPKEGRALTTGEANKLVEVSPLPWRELWYAYLVTGLRKMELASLRWRDIDWDARELQVRSSVAKNHSSRRIPIDEGLWDILKQRFDQKDHRKPGKGKTEAITALVVQRFTRDHVFTTTENTPLTNPKSIYYAFLRCCKAAGIEVKTVDSDGKLVEHVDVHSLRRTFATDLIASGADPKTVQELMGHKTLAMTMNLYTKIHTGTRRQAIGKLSYGQGVAHPKHVLQNTIPIGQSEPKAHRMRTSKLAAGAQST